MFKATNSLSIGFKCATVTAETQEHSLSHFILWKIRMLLIFFAIILQVDSFLHIL
jgi:hypothetical protein